MIPPNPAEILLDAFHGGYAIPALNVNNMETIQGVIAGAEKAQSPVFLQISPGAIAYAGYNTITQMAFSAARAAAIPVLVHLDHCRDESLIRRALADGFPSVMFDGSLLNIDDNARITRALVDIAGAQGSIVEAELGQIGGSESMTLEQARAPLPSPGVAAEFVAATGVQILAPALGNLHRMPDDSVTLDLAHLSLVARAADRPLALHGGSGIDERILAPAIAAGIGKVNISTRVGRAFATGIREVWTAEPEQIDIRRFVGAARQRVAELSTRYASLCGSAGRARFSQSPKRWSDGMEEPE